MPIYSFLIHDAGAGLPSLTFEIAADEATLKALAVAALAADPDRILVEVRYEDRLQFCLHRNGVVWPGDRSRPQSHQDVAPASKRPPHGRAPARAPRATGQSQAW
jgi:hypothetical protein